MKGKKPQLDALAGGAGGGYDVHHGCAGGVPATVVRSGEISNSGVSGDGMQVFKTTVNFTYRDGPGDLKVTVGNNKMQTELHWPKAGMDSKLGYDMRREFPSLSADPPITTGDILGLGSWCQLGRAAAATVAGPEHHAALPADRQARSEGPYEDFWCTLTGAYYSSPGGRRCQLGMAALSFTPMPANRFVDPSGAQRDWQGRRPLGALPCWWRYFRTGSSIRA